MIICTDSFYLIISYYIVFCKKYYIGIKKIDVMFWLNTGQIRQQIIGISFAIPAISRYQFKMSSTDYTPFLLAQITDLQQRLSKQEATISGLKTEVERLTGRPMATMGMSAPTPVKTSIPLTNTIMPDGRASRGMMRDKPMQRDADVRTRRPQIAQSDDRASHQSMSLSDVLKPGEDVTIQVGVGKDGDGSPTFTQCVAVFDGTTLTVTKCELASSLMGMKSTKPGEILYKFIEELKSAGHLKRSFSIAPWKLCSVVRDGSRRTLEQLRTG